MKMLDAIGNNAPRLRGGQVTVLPVARARGTSPEFWELWRESEELLLRRARRMLGNRGMDADDALSITRLKAAGSFECAPQPRAEQLRWLMRILCNACIDIYRERSRSRRGVSLTSDAEASEPSEPADEALDERLHRRRALEAVLAEGAKLPTALRRPLVLRAAFEWTYESIAEHCGITPANARKRVQLARTELLRRLQGQEFMFEM